MTLKPGLYKATVRGVPDVTVMVTERNEATSSIRVKSDSGWTFTYHDPDEHITDARPLIVLDLLPTRTIALVRLLSDPLRHDWAGPIADQIEAQTKPPRIPEPGLWGVVEACRAELSDTSRQKFIRTNVNPGWPWVAADGAITNAWKWEHLGDPVLIRDGAES
jgi:hypothetical protein